MAPREQPVILTAADAAALCEPHFAGCAREKLVVLHLAADRQLVHLAVEDGGGLAHVDLPIRSIVGDAIAHGSAGLILAHCHPSGDPEPSPGDLMATRKLAQMAAGLGIAFHDHLIFGGRDWRSFRALGLL